MLDTRRIHLISCIGVDSELALLPHFLGHYRSIGIAPDAMQLILNTLDPDSPNLATARAILHEHGIADADVWIAPYTSDAMWARRRALQQARVAANDWVVNADVDEFHEYPATLETFLDWCDKRRINVAQGVFIDRLAPHGQLKPIAGEPAMSVQFPLAAEVQCALGQPSIHQKPGGSVKVMAHRGDVFLNRGGHRPAPDNPPIRFAFGHDLDRFPMLDRPVFRWSLPLRVHHYKWTAGLRETLERRLATPGVSPAGAEYGQKLLDHLRRHDGIALADVAVAEPGLAPITHRWPAAIRRRARQARWLVATRKPRKKFKRWLGSRAS